MAERIEFGSLAAANDFRERNAEHLADVDDRRLKVVAIEDGIPEHELEKAEVEAAAGAAERQSGPGHLELNDPEKDRLEPFTPPNHYRKATAVKALLLDSGVKDWEAYYDETLTVDEHRSIAADALEDQHGAERLDAEETPEAKLGRTEKAVGERCDHAEDHCRHGDPAACEFLTDACGFSDDQVAKILDDQEGDPSKGELPGPVYGALESAWTGFRAGLGDAKRWAAAINEIRQQYGQEPLAFEELGDRPITVNDLES